MGETLTAGVPDQFVRQVRDVLAHFYDYSYLLHHPLLAGWAATGDGEAAAAAQELRRALLDALEELRPRPGTPADDPSWRPYSAIHSRYILGKEPAAVEQEMALGKRQVQREQQRGLVALASTLWSTRRAAAGEGGEPRAAAPASPLRQEISRLAAEAESVQLSQLLASAAAATARLASLQGVTLRVAEGPGERVLGDPSLLRQLVVAATSFAIRALPNADLRVDAQRSGACVALRFRAAAAMPLPEPPVPEALAALAEAQRAQVVCGVADGTWSLEVRLPSGQGEQTVAIVEDNEDVVALFSRYLEGRFRLLAVRDTARVLERLAELAPDAIVLDVMMRDVDGWEILQRLKADPVLSHVPVVVCSVLDEPELARSIGAQAYLRKPVRPAQLLDCLAAITRPRGSGAAAPSSAG